MSAHEAIPKYHALMLPVLQAIESLGGSASVREIEATVIEQCGFTDDQLSVQYPSRELSVLTDRLDWARSYCKLAGALESPKRGLFLLTELGREVLALPDAQARQRTLELDRAVRSARSRTKAATDPDSDGGPATESIGGAEGEGDWKEQLLSRLHRLTPTGFEEFSMYLLRRYGLELERIGGSGDEGIDGIGTAPLSPVLSATVAVQAKRYDPTSAIGRDTVALFQRDAAAAGAERAVLVTLGRFTAAARRAATIVTPHVDLIDGERLCELARAESIGVTLLPTVDLHWFDRFDPTLT